MSRRHAPTPPPVDRFATARLDVIDLAGQLLANLHNPAFTEVDLYAAVSGMGRWHLMACLWQLATEFDAKGATYEQVTLDLMAEQMSDVD